MSMQQLATLLPAREENYRPVSKWQQNAVTLSQADNPQVTITGKYDMLPDGDLKRFLTTFWLRMTEAYAESWSYRSKKPTDQWVLLLTKYETQRKAVWWAISQCRHLHPTFPPKIGEFEQICKAYREFDSRLSVELVKLQNDLCAFLDLKRIEEAKGKPITHGLNANIAKAKQKLADFKANNPQVVDMHNAVLALPEPKEARQKRAQNGLNQTKAIKTLLGCQPNKKTAQKQNLTKFAESDFNVTGEDIAKREAAKEKIRQQLAAAGLTQQDLAAVRNQFNTTDEGECNAKNKNLTELAAEV